MEVTQLLLVHRAEVNKANKKSTPLHQASRNGHVATVRLFLKNRADANLADHEGCTPLANALRAGHAEVATLLVHTEQGSACSCCCQ